MNRFVNEKVRNVKVRKRGRNERYSLWGGMGGGGGVRSPRCWRANVMRVYRLRSTFDLPDQVNLNLKVIFDISDNLFYISDLSEGDLTLRFFP